MNNYKRPLMLKGRVEKFHDRAPIYKELCQLADGNSKKYNGFLRDELVPKEQGYGGYKVIDSKHDKQSNFKAVTYEKGEGANKEIVICYVGTDFGFSVKDNTANAKMMTPLATQQEKEALTHYNNTRIKYPNAK